MPHLDCLRVLRADDQCLKSLYPPGSCGTFCNVHTYDCYLKEVKQSCCDEGGANCPAGKPVPNTCPVGCALVFPEFMETCRTHIKQQTTLDGPKFEAFEKKCLAVDSLALVEYALDLQAQGCTIDLHQHRRRTQSYLTQWIGSNDKKCNWDAIDDYARKVDQICCGPGGSRCRGGAPPAGKCSAACAVAAHAFVTDCGATLKVLMPAATDLRRLGILKFETSCIKSTDPKFFLKAIMKAKCPKKVHRVQPPPKHNFCANIMRHGGSAKGVDVQDLLAVLAAFGGQHKTNADVVPDGGEFIFSVHSRAANQAAAAAPDRHHCCDCSDQR
jgi:hypothetical protein